MTQWLNLPARGDIDPLEWDRFGDPATPPATTFYYVLLSDGDDNTGAACDVFDRSEVLTFGCAARPSVPTQLQVLTSMRIHGRTFVVNKFAAVPDPRIYATVETVTGNPVGELSVVFPVSLSAQDFDLGTLSGLSVIGDAVNSLKVTISGESAGSSPGDVLVMMSELLFDYTGLDEEEVAHISKRTAAKTQGQAVTGVSQKAVSARTSGPAVSVVRR